MKRSESKSICSFYNLKEYKPKKFNIGSIHYLHQISAIPSDIRDLYLQKLSKRKNSEKQKNIKLIKIIYFHIADNRINEWNPDNICDSLNVSNSMLRYHKSRFLKGLKEFYVNWKEIAKNLEKSFQKDHNLPETFDKDTIKFNLYKAGMLYDSGLLKEASIIFLKAEKKLVHLNSGNYHSEGFLSLKDKYLTRSEIYEYLIRYFYNLKSYENLRIYLNKFKYLVNVPKRKIFLLFSEKEIRLLNLRYNICKSIILSINYNKNRSSKTHLILLQKTYLLAKSMNQHKYMLEILRKISILFCSEDKYSDALHTCHQGQMVTSIINAETESYFFHALSLYINIQKNIKIDFSIYNKILKFYNKIKRTFPLNPWVIQLESCCIMAYQHYGNNELFKLFMAHINSCILKYDYTFAFYWKFILNSELYKKQIINSLTFVNENQFNISRKYLSMQNIDFNLLKKIDSLCLNTIHSYKELSEIKFIDDVYMAQLISILLNRDGIDFKWAKSNIERLERIYRRRNSKNKSFELIKVLFKLLYNSSYYYDKHWIKKYEHKIKYVINNFIKDMENFNMIDYVLMIYVTKKLNIKEFLDTVIGFYCWLENNNPDILKPVLNQIEKRNKAEESILHKELPHNYFDL